MPPFLIKLLLSLELSSNEKRLPKGHPSTDIFRIVTLESRASGAQYGAPKLSADLHARVHLMIAEAVSLLLVAGSSRVRALAAEEQDSEKKEALLMDVAENEELAKSVTEAVKTGEYEVAGLLTWIVAEKVHTYVA